MLEIFTKEVHQITSFRQYELNPPRSKIHLIENVAMKNQNELSMLGYSEMRKEMIKTAVNITDVIEKKINEFDLQLSLLSESLNMTESNVIYSRIETLRAKLSVSSRNIENIQTVIIVSLIKD